ncbi:Polyketide cyclase / dehydrase and lipid transport [Austwickia chelonae]|uniref:Polyketide cyclase/dehydrase n=1 Tax=Austwickia chelonae NBRC 105200 TaxID=1184607 RepID=K6VJV2_9MICO|nr:SRPBCC family protein [Austwickia chelonae]GAB76979.1 hypothetical protein AUCHE_04_00190 [Austwickia chelonae NBRC 105200]SEW32950.1 Polyketide cyclase / dehydrase and lipid transport [Austwickia chelonae]
MANFTITRSVHIDATPERVQQVVEDLRHWESWTPWEQLDPEVQHTYPGATSGVGAVYTWAGDSSAGEGRMEIVASEPGRVDLLFAMTQPSGSTHDLRLDITPVDGGTDLTWTFIGKPKTLLSKFLSAVLRLDQQLGDYIEQALERFKTEAEKA